MQDQNTRHRRTGIVNWPITVRFPEQVLQTTAPQCRQWCFHKKGKLLLAQYTCGASLSGIQFWGSFASLASSNLASPKNAKTAAFRASRMSFSTSLDGGVSCLFQNKGPCTLLLLRLAAWLPVPDPLLLSMYSKILLLSFAPFGRYIVSKCLATKGDLVARTTHELRYPPSLRKKGVSLGSSELADLG